MPDRSTSQSLFHHLAAEIFTCSSQGSYFIMCETRHSFSIINLTYQDGQEGSPSNPVGFKGQDYSQLRDTCLHTGSLFVDSSFPPSSQSLGDLPDLSSWREAQVEWLRPHVKFIGLNVCNCKKNKKKKTPLSFILRCFFTWCLAGDLEITKHQRRACFLPGWSIEV